ncbi:MAG: hypothetical protein U9N79_02585 [Actinomycetota bacterium]|nr:hypothetical protein [Actinomycetota bacterium]
MNHEDILERMSNANPTPDVDMITDGQLAELAMQIEQERREATDLRDRQPAAQSQELPSGRATRESRFRRLRPAIAFASALLLVLAVFGVLALVRPSQPDVADQPAPSPTTTVAATSATTPGTTILPVAGAWNPILTDTRAKAAPPAATCPEGADPDTPGPAGQDEPVIGPVSDAGGEAGAFDTRTGRVVYLDSSDETWTFDVCTNTWHQMNATGATRGVSSGSLVYDVDSDVTVALGGGHVYDANTNTWTWLPLAFLGPGVNRFKPSAGVYDPVSGLIITTRFTDDDHVELWAYDVDTNTATPVGRLGDLRWEDCFGLLGYSREIDRLIFGSIHDVTALVDPRTGETTLISTPTPGGVCGLVGEEYASAGDTAYVAKGVWHDGDVFRTRFPGEVCGFDVDTSAWTPCFAIRGGSLPYQFEAMVGDSINDRLVFIHGVNPNFGPNADGDVWAIDLDTGETTELLTPLNP